MNNINMMIKFANPLFLLLIIPVIGLILFRFFTTPKTRRINRNRIASSIIHLCIMIFTILVLSGVSFTQSHSSAKNDIIILVDASESVVEQKTKVDSVVEDILEESTSEQYIGIVSFGTNFIYSAEMSNNKQKVLNEYLNSSSVQGDGTDIYSAMMFAHSKLKNPLTGRIIVITDGNETDNKAIYAAQSISNTGTRIDTIFISPITTSDEVKLNSIDYSSSIDLNVETLIDVVVESRKSTNAYISLYCNNTLMEKRYVRVSSGAQTIQFPYTFESSNLHEFKAIVECEDDNFEQNNIIYSFKNLSVSNKVLFVEGNNVNALDLQNIVKDNYNIDIVNVSNTPQSTIALTQYEEVVLLNVKSSQIRDTGFDVLLDDYVYNYGGALMNVSGTNSYESDMQNSLLEDMLPVEVTDQANPVSIMLVIDKSSSMNTIVPGLNVSIMEVARRAAKAAASVLKDSDYIGIVEFDNDANLLLDLTPATRIDEINAVIDTMEAGYGTKYKDAVVMAGDKLALSNKTNLKHIIFVSDGAPTDSGYVPAVRALADGITLSTIAIGNNSSDGAYNPQALMDMAEEGYGRFYMSDTGSDLVDIMVSETTITQSQKENNETFVPVIEDITHKSLNGVTSLPEFNGYYGGIKLKSEAKNILSYKGDPILSTWQYGKGKTASLMIDLSGKYSSDLFVEEQGQLFINNLFGSFFNDNSIVVKDIEAEFLGGNFSQTIGIRTNTTDVMIFGELTTPSGRIFDIDLNTVSDSYLTCNIGIQDAGLYTFRVFKKDYNGNVISDESFYYTHSYSKEYTVFYNESVCLSFTQQLASSGGGSVITDINGMFNTELLSYETITDPSVVFISICIVLFLLDVAARKFKFKLPNEFKKGDNNERNL